MLMFREKIPEGWLEHILKNIDQVLVDHAHLERKAATSAITLGKYRPLWHKAGELNAIAIEELQHFQLVLDILDERSIVFQSTSPSPWINGLMKATRKGVQGQVIDHLLVAALIEGRSCEKFQLLAAGLAGKEPELARFYASLVESEGNHYASYILMAREMDEDETRQRLDYFLDIDASLISVPNPLPVLH
ncbi:MAG: tRNA-(ms[2]io[6]A)-hydroxylase [Verrucomicrobia bacterium]|nr:tRNA-(ms[2]io[6]A)-hydroxylase [Verrucomicrobiota bacterium]